MAQQRFDLEEVEGIAVATLSDRKILNETHIQMLGNQLFYLVDEEGHDRLVLDFHQVEYFSSVCLDKLITLQRKIADVKGKLLLCGMRPDVYELFAITKLNRKFSIVDDRQQALDMF